MKEDHVNSEAQYLVRMSDTHDDQSSGSDLESNVV